jgi:hypothetical protein
MRNAPKRWAFAALEQCCGIGLPLAMSLQCSAGVHSCHLTAPRLAWIFRETLCDTVPS